MTASVSTNPKYEENMRSNPMEICSIAHSTQTFAVQSGLAEAGTGDDANQPLKLYAKLSRFPICIIQNHEAVTANVGIRDLPGIFARSEFCLQREIELSIAGMPSAQEEGQKEDGKEHSIAYTQILASGKGMRGKTAVQFLQEAAGDEEKLSAAMDALNSQYRWLSDNLKKNPESKYAAGNRAQMEAIKDAARLCREGKIEASSGNSAGVRKSVDVFASGFRPLIRKKRADGMTPVSEYSIVWTFGNAYPVELSIRNYYAPVAQREDGRLNVMAGKKTEERCYRMKFSIDEWEYVLYMIKANMRIFENCYGPNALRVSSDQFERNRKNAVAAASVSRYAG